ncbi:hypothetical protein JCM11491_006010 [Sporobolomyces phaffii]
MTPDRVQPESPSLANKDKSQKLFSKVACAGCRAIKVKCRLASGELPTGEEGESCTRCSRLKIPCEYKSATRRGRKPKTLLAVEAAARHDQDSTDPDSHSVDQLMDTEQQSATRSLSSARQLTHPPYPSPVTSTSGLPKPVPVGYLPEPLPQPRPYHALSPLMAPMPPTFPSPSPYAASRPLGPPPPPIHSSLPPSLSPLLGPPRRPPSNSSQHSSYTQPHGPASTVSPASQNSPIRLYQSTADSLAEAAATKSLSFDSSGFTPRTQPTPTHPDPIDLHVLGSLEASQLFEFYHSRLNCFIILLDRKLHTPEFVRKSSTVLFTSVLAVSAKFFRPDLYQTLLLSAQQLVVRGCGEGTNVHLGLIQACLLLVYWKQPNDSSAWIRTGFALRAAYQLGLHVKRTTALPNNEHEARLILDRERTWITLICFDASFVCSSLPLRLTLDPLFRELTHRATSHSYQLSAPSSGVYETRMVSVHDVDIFAWLEETKPYEVRDDWEQGASIELIKVLNLLPSIATAPTKVIASSVVGLVNEKLSAVWAKYLDTNSPSHQELEGLAQHKIRFHFFAASVQVGKSCLAAAGVEDAVILSFFLSRCGSLVDCFEDLTAGESPVFLMMQDNISIQLMGFGEMLGKLFPQVSPSVQATIVDYLTRIYRASTAAARGDSENIPAYVSRFFRAILRSIHPIALRSVPPTRPSSPSRGPNTVPSSLPAQANPFEQLGVVASRFSSKVSLILERSCCGHCLAPVHRQEQELLLNADVDTLVTSLRSDGSYWDSLFPGQSSWSWLDSALSGDQTNSFTF